MQDNRIVLTKPCERFVFSGIGAKPAVSLNRGFSAPIKLTLNQTHEELAQLAARDNDPFNRWQALQSIANELLIANVAAHRRGESLRQPDELIAAFRNILSSPSLEPAFSALAIALPSEGDIARDIGTDIDHDAIFATRLAARRAIGKALDPELTSIYRGLSSRAPYSPDAASAGRRSLRNGCLDLLASNGDSEKIELAAQQFRDADNMTDRLAALSTLSLHNVPAREQAFAEFYERFRADALVLDKWFILQAAIPESATLARVRSLLTHPTFSLSNPNRVRSLIGTFAQANLTQFNRADGAGYEFLAENVKTLDPKNPQVAARLMTAFRTWRALEPKRRALAERALRRVANTSGLSRDVADIAERSLADA